LFVQLQIIHLEVARLFCTFSIAYPCCITNKQRMSFSPTEMGFSLAH